MLMIPLANKNPFINTYKILYELPYMKKHLLIVIITLIYIGANQAHARWATPEDANIVREIYHQVIKVNADGTFEQEVEIREKILKDVGRERAAKYSLYYNGDAEELKLIEAKTIFKNKEYIVPQKNIEDKPLASLGQGFDHIKRVFIAFPNTEVGSQIYLKYKHKIKKPDLEKFFALLYQFGDEYEIDTTLKIQSALPLNIKVNDPHGVLQTNSYAKNNSYFVEASLTKPFYSDVINEPEKSVVNLKNETWISISSVKDWGDLAIKLSKDYQRVIDQDIPDLLQEIIKVAENEKDELKQINLVTSRINEKIQYLGDWRSVDGRFKPRDLTQISQKQIGDCKDFSAATSAILNKLGYKAQIALVRRGALDQSDLEVLPYIGAFNHAMVKVTNKEGKVYWIDPTNSISMAGGIFPDIENKMALILDSLTPKYEKISAIDFQHAAIESIREITIKGDLVEDHADITLKGEAASEFTGISLNASIKHIEEAVFQIFSGTNIEEENRKSIVLPDLSSRIVNDLNFKVHYEQKNLTVKTNLGFAYPLKNSWVKDITEIASDNIGDLYIGPSITRKKQTLFKNILVNDIEKLNYKIETPWLVASRSCSKSEQGFEVVESFEILTSFIPNEDLKSAEFKKLQDTLKQNVENSAIVFSEHSQDSNAAAIVFNEE